MARPSVLRIMARVTLDGALSPDVRAARVVQIAHDGRDALIAAGRASSKYLSFADGKQDGDELKATRTLAYKFQYLGEGIFFLLTQLQAFSPVDSGRFRASFMVAVNGSAVPASLLQIDKIPSGATIQIYNRQPYSRKVDVQLVGNRKLRFSVPPNLYDRAAKATLAQYGNLLRIERRTDLTFPDMWLRKRNDADGRRRIGTPVQYPSLLVTSI